jgi:Restriction endonuclease/Topoisomerase DNA binding C4 zinc finger
VWIFSGSSEGDKSFIDFLQVAGVVGGILVLRFVFFGDLRGRRCSHGIHPKSRRICLACQEQDVAKNKKREEDRLRAERRQQLESYAWAMRREELARLTSEWLSNFEAYLQMDEWCFEDAIAELFRKLGYDVSQTPYTNDGGKDAIAWKDGKKYLIECKRYGVKGITGRPQLSILFAAMHDEKADGAYFITTGRFTSGAIEYGRRKQIELYDRASLPTLINRAYGLPNSLSRAKVICEICGSTVHVEVLPLGSNTGYCHLGHAVTCDFDQSWLRPLGKAARCMRCNSPMRLINGRRGKFYGCSTYPQCRWSQPYRGSRRVRPKTLGRSSFMKRSLRSDDASPPERG